MSDSDEETPTLQSAQQAQSSQQQPQVGSPDKPRHKHKPGLVLRYVIVI